MTQCRLGITKCFRDWTLCCCSPKPTMNSTYRSHLHCSSWHVGLCIGLLTGYILGWHRFVEPRTLTACNQCCSLQHSRSPSSPSPRSQQQWPGLTVPNWAHKGNPTRSDIFRVLCKVFFSNRCSEAPNTVWCRSPGFTSA